MVSERMVFNTLDGSRNAKDAPSSLLDWETVQDIYNLQESDLIYSYRKTLSGWNSDPWDDESIGLRGELSGDEYYALVRIFNTHFLTTTERSLIENKIHGAYPNSNVYFHEHHETDETGVEYPNYCHAVSSEMDASVIALEAAGLIKSMEENRCIIEDEKPDYYDIVWVIKPEE